jgi:prepilin-type processing-associated H-X9-DG protein
MSYGGNLPSGPYPNQPQGNQNWAAPNPPPVPQPGKNNSSRIILIVSSVVGLSFFCLCLPLALLLPAVQNARESGRRAVCLNNIRNLGLAVASFDASRRSYPGYRDTLSINTTVSVNGVPTNKVPVNWLITLLPNLERPDLYRNWKNLTAVDFSADGQVTYTFPSLNGTSLSPRVYMELLVCPSDSEGSQPQPVGQGQPISYIVNSGLQDVPATTESPADWPANGVFVSRWEMPIAATKPQLLFATSNANSVSIGDGVSETVLMSENLGAGHYDDAFVNVGGPGSLQKPVSEQWNCFVWQPHYPLPSNLSQAQINGRPTNSVDPSIGLASNITYARPSSAHPGGANFVYCDTHTRFISENIDYLVLTLLMMSNDRQAKMPGTGDPLPKVFTTTEFKEGMVH